MPRQTDPIYQIGALYPPIKINLITSDEPSLPGRESADVNSEYIREHFRKIGTKVTLQHLELEYFEENCITLAGQIIQEHQKNPEMPIVLDISAGRGTIRQALSRAGEIAIDYIHKFHDPTFILTYTIKSTNKPVISYHIGKPLIPNSKDIELLKVVELDMTQTQLTKKLAWNNQSEVSKAMGRLIEMDLIEKLGHRTRKLTNRGKQVKKLIDYLNEMRD